MKNNLFIHRSSFRIHRCFSMPISRAKIGCGVIAATLILIVIGATLMICFLRSQQNPEPTPQPSPAPVPAKGELQVHVLDVGQGDSILVVSPAGKTALIDTGNPGNWGVIQNALKRVGARQIDLFVATHAHADHIGSAVDVLNNFPVQNVLDSRQPNNTRTYERYLEAVQEDVVSKGGKFIAAQPGQTFDLGDGAKFTVLAPIQPFFTKSQLRQGGNEPNANSVVLRLDFGKFSMLLPGDAEAATEDRILDKGENVRADVLKVGHHGSRYATSEEFIRAGHFKDAIISDGANNDYGHPSQEALDRLRNAGVKVWRTDLQGEITVLAKPDGTYRIIPEHQATGDLLAGRTPARDDSSGYAASRRSR
jgi:competence protein ComEC